MFNLEFRYLLVYCRNRLTSLINICVGFAYFDVIFDIGVTKHSWIYDLRIEQKYAHNLLHMFDFFDAQWCRLVLSCG